jgi:cytidylate kinase
MSSNVLISQAAGSFQYVPSPSDSSDEKDRYAPGELPFITISREAWALGRELAETIVREMSRRGMGEPFQGFKIFDRELCEKISAERGLQAPLYSLLSERFHPVLENYLLELMPDRSPQYKIQHRMMAMILELASVGRCIVVGRGGVCITRKLPGGVHVRLVAPKEIRVRRMADHYGIDRAVAHERIERQDEDRKEFIREYFHRDISDPLLYDAVFNTDRVSLEIAARQVIGLAEERFREVMTRRGPAAGARA